jgi:hypothetical protein
VALAFSLWYILTCTIKLTVTFLVCGNAMVPKTGRIKLGWELIAGAAAGGCQVVCPESAFSCLTFIPVGSRNQRALFDLAVASRITLYKCVHMYKFIKLGGNTEHPCLQIN